ncbi:MAG: hypothetical protein WCS69_04560 [Ignavibacteriaceae bacterium]
MRIHLLHWLVESCKWKVESRRHELHEWARIVQHGIQGGKLTLKNY